MTAVDRFLSGHSDAETLADLRCRITRWLMDDSGPDLSRVLGLGTRRAARLQRRDALLRQAASLLDGPVSARARALLEVARLVEVRRAAVWSRRGVPENADPVERLIFEASQLDTIPRTCRMMREIINAESESIAHHHCAAGIRYK